jgi:hypothetical protein
LRDRLPIALSSVAALRQGQHAFDALDRYGETDGAWRAPRNLWQNATATTWACDRIIGGKAAAGCLDLGMNALAPMGPRGWARTFLRGDIKMLMNPLTRYYYHGDASASSNMLLPCGWTSPTDRSTLIFSFGHQSNIYHFYFLHLLPVFHIARILQAQRISMHIFLLDSRPRPPPWALVLLKAASGASSVILEGDVASPWCFRDAIIRNHNSWYLPSKLGKVDFDRFKLPQGLAVDEDMVSMVARVKAFFNISMLLSNANAPRAKPSAPVVLYSLRDPPRYLKNRDQVVEYARQQHFSVSLVHFRGMPMKEQVRLVAQSDVLVGVHGANLANLLYLDRGRSAALLEIFPRLYPEEMPCELPQCETYNTFAAHLGIRYFRVFGVDHDDEDNRKWGMGSMRMAGRIQRGKDLRRRTVVLKKDALAVAITKIWS